MNDWQGGKIGGLVLVALAGCTSTPTSSVVTGTIDQQGFPSPARSITLVNDEGDKADVAIEANGAFRAKVKKGTKWGLFLSGDTGAIPVVLRQQDGRLETSVLVETGGVNVDLGLIRFWPGSTPSGAPTQELRARPADGLLIVNQGGGEVVESTPPGASGDAQVTCQSADDDSDSDSDSDSDDGENEGDDDDALQEGAATDVALVLQGDPHDRLAIGTYNLPEVLACAEFDDDSDSDSDDDSDGDD